MILFKNKTKVIEAYKEINRPLNDIMVNDLDEVTQELRDLGISEEWVVVDLRCRICSHEQTAIVPAISDLDNLECGNCGNMTAQESDDKEWWQE